MNELQTSALLLDESLQLRLGSRDVAAPMPGEALVRIEWAGVCGSDLHAMRSGAWIEYWPAVLGHEIVGVIESCPNAELGVGTRVVVDSRLPCRRCDGCTRAFNQCQNLAWVGEKRPGGYERYATFDVASLHTCPTTMEPPIAVLAEPLAVALHAVNAIGQAPDRVLILGHGPIGALAQLVVRSRWPQTSVFVIEVNPERRQLAAAFGAVVVAGEASGESWPVVLDTAGYAGSLLDALSRVQNGGRVVLVALAHQPVELLPADLVEHAVTLIGVNGFDNELPQAIELLAKDADTYRPVITEALLLEEAADRLRGLDASPAVGKVVIQL